MRRILIFGCLERPNGFFLGDGRYYDRARLIMFDEKTGKYSVLIKKELGGENYPNKYPNIQFTAGSLTKNGIWVPTDTEVGFFRFPDLSMEKLISFPSFNNIHHVCEHEEGIFIVNTGLDMVVKIDKDLLDIEEEFSVVESNPWNKFNKEVDYRKINSTKPHKAHPNYIFNTDGKYWVTRCNYGDAVYVYDNKIRIDITRGRNISVHDGVVSGDYIYFTTVDGHIVVVNSKTKKIEADLNLTSFGGERVVRGWCRGIDITPEGIAYVSFSRLRPTRQKSKIGWIKNIVKRKIRIKRSASILCVDLNSRKIINEWDIDESIIHAIYTVKVLPEEIKITSENKIFISP